MRTFFVAALLACVLPAAAGAATVRIGHGANGKTVTVHRGDTLRVSLAGNASTGFAWLVQKNDPAVLWFARRTYTPAPHPPHVIGTGGTYHLGFRARSAGTANLRLTYAQPFNRTQPRGSFRVTVVVKP